MARGIAADSLRGGPLAGAFVVVEGTGRGGIVDAAGRFRIDSIPPGRHRMVLMHGILDSLSLAVMTPSFAFLPGDSTWIELGTPSPETVVRAKCGEGPFVQGPAALFGLVVNSETEEPLEGASVVVAWTEVSAGREIGLRSVPRQRVATTAADGTFRICGVPSELNADMFASHGGDTTGIVPVRLDHPLFGIVPLAVPKGGTDVVVRDTSVAPSAGTAVAPEAPVLRRGTSTLRGRVTTVSGAPVPGARVSVHGADGVALTDADGRFALGAQPSGSQTAIVRKLGYEPVEFAVILAPARPRDVDVQLADFVPVLETVRVQARRSALDVIGFNARQRSGMGTFIGPEELDRRAALRLTDYFANIPTLRVINTGGYSRAVTGRSRGLSTNCVQWYVDDILWIGDGSPEDFINPHEIGAIEVYSATSTPVQFMRSGTGCETIVLWTKFKLDARSQ